MSKETEKTLFLVENVDVDSSVKENEEISENLCDSGVESGASCPSTVPTVDNNDLVELKDDETRSTADLDHTSAIETISASPDFDDVTENLLSLEECSIKNYSATNEVQHPSVEYLNTSSNNENCGCNKTATATDSNDDFKCEELKDASDKVVCSDLEAKRNLATSSVSLQDQMTLNSDITISKSLHSKSAENISVNEVNTGTNELNTNQILSEFAAQKNKAAAIQKLPTDGDKIVVEPSKYLDSIYTKLPKESLSQDLGSIVKNVHGIFSSVSGSLKYAYNHSQRIPKPPIMNFTKPITNGKLMDDIFEEKSEKVFENSDDKMAARIDVPGEQNVEEALLAGEQKGEPDMVQQIELLARQLAEQRKENISLNEKLKKQSDLIQEKDNHLKELEVKVDMMRTRMETSVREKDAAVMRYAQTECAAIEARRAGERAAQAERAARAEAELLANKLKSAHAEKQRICQLYDDKCHELSTSERELSKTREDLKELEGRLKWTQSKLRMEMDAYKESAERAEKLSQQVSELGAAKDAAAASAGDSARARQLEVELKESQAALILCRHEKEDLERRLAATTQQYDSCKRERDSATSDLSQANKEIEQLKINNVQLEEEAAELAALRAQAALADTLAAQLQRQRQALAAAEEALGAARAAADTCARREAAALQHAAHTTAAHCALSARAAAHAHHVQALTLDNEALRERVSNLEEECSKLQTALNEECDKRNKETRALARKVAELTEELAEVNKKLEWEQGENTVLKKKHNNAIKELNRELQRAVKRCKQLETRLTSPDAASSRAGSVSSLSSGESAPQEERVQNGHTESLPDVQARSPDRQQLIERIVSLQRAAARRSERCEFLEEHARQLTGELRAKARLLRHLLPALPAGALATPHSDDHKKEIARLGGGAMAALWGGDATGMTLELSLEMNTRLQAVLEDALLKNITLKENMDTLGEEIARLKKQMNSNTENSK